MAPRPGSGGLPYLPYGPDLDGVPHVFVDGLRATDTVMELSHWPGNRTPQAYRSDVSTGAVLKFLRDSGADARSCGAEAVTCDHYDVDGLLSVWSLVRPREALHRAALLTAVATSGDFDTWTTPDAVRACLALHQWESTVASRTAFRSAGSTEAATALLFSAMLYAVPLCVDRPECITGWEWEWQEIVRGLEWLDTGRAVIEENDEADLAVVRSKEPVHPYAVNARTERLLVAESTPEQGHRLRFRYESFVDMQSRPVAERIRGDLLAEELREIEPGGWMCEPPDTATPSLQRFGPTRDPASSQIPFDRFVACVVDFCRRAAVDPKLRWRGDATWVTTAAVRPPSGRVL